MELLTNGTLWTKDLVHRLAPLISRVQISIDGYSEDTNSKIRGKGNFDKALLAVEEFYDCGVDTEVSVTPVLDSNLENDYIKYVEFANRLNARFPSQKFIIKFTYDILTGREINLNDISLKKYQSVISKITNLLYSHYEDRPFVMFHRKGGIEDTCDYGNVVVSADGQISLCPIIQQTRPVGNTRKDNLQTIFDSAAKARQISNVNNLMPCKKCELKYICGGDCRIKYFSGFKECDFMLMEGAERVCNESVKNRIYDLMIETDQYLYR